MSHSVIEGSACFTKENTSSFIMRTMTTRFHNWQRCWTTVMSLNRSIPNIASRTDSDLESMNNILKKNYITISVTMSFIDYCCILVSTRRFILTYKYLQGFFYDFGLYFLFFVWKSSNVFFLNATYSKTYECLRAWKLEILIKKFANYPSCFSYM